MAGKADASDWPGALKVAEHWRAEDRAPARLLDQTEELTPVHHQPPLEA